MMADTIYFHPSVEKFDMRKVAQEIRNLMDTQKPEDWKILTQVPFWDCVPGMCSEASAAMVLNFLGHNDITPQSIYRDGFEIISDMEPLFRNIYQHCGRYVWNQSFCSIINMIEEMAPVPVRIVPDGQTGGHTVVVVGFSGGCGNPLYFYVHDCALSPFMKVRVRDFIEQWKRHNNEMMRYWPDKKDA